jgi:hypothetical protein
VRSSSHFTFGDVTVDERGDRLRSDDPARVFEKFATLDTVSGSRPNG